MAGAPGEPAYLLYTSWAIQVPPKDPKRRARVVKGWAPMQHRWLNHSNQRIPFLQRRGMDPTEMRRNRETVLSIIFLVKLTAKNQISPPKD